MAKLSKSQQSKYSILLLTNFLSWEKGQTSNDLSKVFRKGKTWRTLLLLRLGHVCCLENRMIRKRNSLIECSQGSHFVMTPSYKTCSPSFFLSPLLPFHLLPLLYATKLVTIFLIFYSIESLNFLFFSCITNCFLELYFFI